MFLKPRLHQDICSRIQVSQTKLSRYKWIQLVSELHVSWCERGISSNAHEECSENRSEVYHHSNNAETLQFYHRK